MSTPYQRGAAFEHRVKNFLESEHDYLVTRSPASKSPFDLLAMCPGHDGLPHVYLIQCKLRGVISPRDRLALVELAERYGAHAILAYTLKLGGEIHFKLAGPGGTDVTWSSWSP